MTNNSNNFSHIAKLEMLSTKLEIFIITYNRSTLLLNTLEQLKNSPFSFCKITVLDNCSTDNTVSIANSKIAEFKNLCLISHKLNIGAGANALRVIELSNGIYTWLLCDDDNYDFSDCSDVIDAILNETYDLIHMGAHDEYWKYGAIAATPKELLTIGYPYFKYCSFLPCNLFRTKRFYCSINKAYENIHNWYPHIPFLLDFLTNSDLIYISKNRIVTASVSYSGSLGQEVLKKWFNCANLMSERKYKLIFILNQGLIVKKDITNPINKVLISNGANVIFNRNFEIILKLFLFTDFLQSILLLLSIIISPVWYFKRKWL